MNYKVDDRKSGFPRSFRPLDSGSSLAAFGLRLGPVTLLIGTTCVQEILAPATVICVPGVPSYVAGIVPYGEGALTILHLAERLDLPADYCTAEAEATESRVVVVRHGELEAGLVCSQALGVRRVDSGRIAAVATLVMGELPKFLVGELDESGERVGVLDVGELLEQTRRDLHGHASTETAQRG